MIFLTIGTHEPFDRLIKAVDEWIEQVPQEYEIFAQVVSPPVEAYIPRNFEMTAHLSPMEYEDRIRQADLIVSHAGMGTILTAFTYGKPIIIMPRRGHFRETRNDHQYTTVKNLTKRPGLFVAEDETQFSIVMDKAIKSVTNATPPRLSAVADVGFTDALHRFLLSSTKL
ncbi:glycosyltransferase [Kordiimonas sp.]|uniref:glycosyltransferase n=1 Tax=Kordiimonas sp. TaxID=1970157 RepID=UPI003A933B87